VANLGDTRAVINIDGTAKRVSVDHKPTAQSEIERVKYLLIHSEKKEE
jgi:serine/threonine protein phosphatase PrpC